MLDHRSKMHHKYPYNVSKIKNLRICKVDIPIFMMCQNVNHIINISFGDHELCRRRSVFHLTSTKVEKGKKVRTPFTIRSLVTFFLTSLVLDYPYIPHPFSSPNSPCNLHPNHYLPQKPWFTPHICHFISHQDCGAVVPFVIFRNDWEKSSNTEWETWDLSA